MEQYRHEYKYLLSDLEDRVIARRAASIMAPDPHAGPDGQYAIRSLYFDSIDDRCFFENEDGTDPREKFRIRIYNGSDARISLECKRKERGKTRKTACLLDREQCLALMAGQIPPVGEDQAVLRRLVILIRTELFRPRIIVEYDRTPFVYGVGNVRVTLDRNIRASLRTESFLEPTLPTRPILPVGQQLLEVKFDALLPDFLQRSMELGTLAQTAFSKYYLCRRFHH